MDNLADGCNMRKLTSLLIGGAIVAWMAYLSWPVTAELPVARQKSVPMSNGLRQPDFHESEAYEYSAPKSAPQPSV